MTLFAATSVNVPATIKALVASLDQIDFAGCILFTDRDAPELDPRIKRVPIDPLTSSRNYSEFMLKELPTHLTTDHCLVVQWDGFVIEAGQWQPGFLDFDYIGAPWPQFPDGGDVGNGGFSLRSRKLLEACMDPRFEVGHPEDVSICRTNRRLLEYKLGVRFADRRVAERFAFERTTPERPSFGFHGVFNMIPLLGADRFWSLYRALDDRSSVFADYPLLMRQLRTAPNAWARRLALTIDRFVGERRPGPYA